VRPELLADAVHEELDAAATRTAIDVEMLAVREELPEISEKKTPTPASLMELFRSHILQTLAAPGAVHGIHFGRFGHVILRIG
jgi:hypothetical protein